MPTISSKIEICMTKAAFLQFKGIWGSDRPTVLCLYLFITLTLSSPPFPLISRPLHIFLCFIYFALFTSSSPLYSCLPLSYIFCSSLSLISLPAFPEETVNSGFTVMVKREQGLKKKHHCGLCYHQLRCTGQLCPQCPSFCVTLMWPVRRESYHWRFKVTQTFQGGVCSRRTWKTKDLSVWDGLRTTLFVAISAPTPWLHPPPTPHFLVWKRFLTNPPWIVATLQH